ncbi:MAG: hypothetical protein U5J99_00965 [Parvularculaceae bacterium]|nr:hypothetical protein [Parvularculaceae bacterium]
MKRCMGLVTAAVLAVAPAALASPLAGDFNTGPSLVEEANGASLNIRFHPCTDDTAQTCASVLEMVEPEGPSGSTLLPNGEPIVGFVMIRGLTPKGEGAFRSGEIAAIDESLVKGKMVWYGLKIDKNADGTLAATGCLGFICPRKMTWTAVGAPALPAARP